MFNSFHVEIMFWNIVVYKMYEICTVMKLPCSSWLLWKKEKKKGRVLEKGRIYV